MAASWSPSVAQATNLIHAWEASSDDTLVTSLIAAAVNEVTAEAGDFDPSVVINPSAEVGDQVTLGSLAADAAAIRTAHMWASSIAPEFNDPEFVRSLYARFVDALDRLRWRAGTSGTDAFTITPSYTAGFEVAEDWT